MKKLFSVFSIFALFLASVPPAMAGDCYSHPVEVYSGTATVNSGVNVRNRACMEGSSVVGSLSGGATVKVLAHNDGWYEVTNGSVRGWLWGSFVNVSASPTGVSKSYADYEATYAKTTETIKTEPIKTTADSTLSTRVKGHILLQVEKYGEAWYMDPVTMKRYYMKDGPTAYQMMRSFGLGVSEKDYASMQTGSYALKDKLRGRIVLRAHAKGEAYYIHPKDLKMYYLKNGEEAYKVMRLYSLGITNADLEKLSASTIPLK